MFVSSPLLFTSIKSLELLHLQLQKILYPVVSPSGVGGVQDNMTVVAFIHITVGLSGGEATVTESYIPRSYIALLKISRLLSPNCSTYRIFMLLIN